MEGFSRALMRADAYILFGVALTRTIVGSQYKTPNLQNSLNPNMPTRSAVRDIFYIQHLAYRALSRALVIRALSQKLSCTGGPRTLIDAGQSKANPQSNSFMEGFWRRSIIFPLGTLGTRMVRSTTVQVASAPKSTNYRKKDIIEKSFQ